MPDIILNDNDQVIFERTSGGRYDVRLLGGKNSEGKDTVITTLKPNETLVVSGSGKAAEITLPDNIGIDPDDPVPRITLQTDNPVRIIGAGKFSMAKESSQAAVIEVSPVNLTAMTVRVKDDKEKTPVISAPKHSPKENDEKTSQQLSFKDERSGMLRTVTVENKTKDAAGAEIIFVNPHDKTEIYTFSGKEPLAKNNAGFQKLVNDTKASIIKAFAKDSADEKKRLGLEKNTPVEEAQTPSSPTESKPAEKPAADMRKETTTIIDEMRKEITQIKSQPPQKRLLDKNPSIKTGMESLDKALTAVAGTHGNPSKEQKKALHDALDKIMDAATEAEKDKKDIPNQAAARILKGKIKDMQNKVEKAEGLKISMVMPGLPEAVLANAQQAVDPMLSGSMATLADHNHIVSPPIGGKTPAGGYRSV